MCHTPDVWLNRFVHTRAIWSKQTGWHENWNFNKKVCSCSAATTEVHIHKILIHTNTSSRSLNFISMYNIYKKFELEKGSRDRNKK